MKHIDIKYCFIEEIMKLREIRVRYISTELNWADVLTKALVPKKRKDSIEARICSKDAYRLVVAQKGVLAQYAATYAELKCFRRLDIILEDRTQAPPYLN